MGEETGQESSKSGFRIPQCVFVRISAVCTLAHVMLCFLPDDSDAVRRKYKKDLDHLKPDLEAYNRQKEIALGLAAGTLTKAGSSSSAVVPTSQEQQLAAENLYRNANTLIYGDNKPSEDAIDKVVSKINQEYVLSHSYTPSGLTFHSVDKKRKFSRKRANEDEGDITYINERNRIFNKKVGHSLGHRRGEFISLFSI